MLEKLTVEQFAACVSDTFRIHLDSSTLDSVLIEARRLGAASDDRRPPFSLVFRGPRSPILAQRIYRTEHSRLGMLEIFLVPIGPDEAGMRYEAIFT